MKTYVAALVLACACAGSQPPPAPPSNREAPAGPATTSEPAAAGAPEVAFTMSAQTGLAAGTGALRGTLADSTGQLVIGATVVATSPQLVGEQVVLTDEHGAFEITALPAGAYTITVYYSEVTFSHEATIVAAKVTDMRVTRWNTAPPPGSEIIEIR